MRFLALLGSFALVGTSAAAGSNEDLVAISAGGDFYRIDQTSGALTFLSHASTGTTSIAANSLARDGAGRLYTANNVPGVTRIVRLDPTTGASQIVASLPLLDVRGLAFADDGALYAINDDLPDELLRIDLVAQTATFVADLGFPALQSLTFREGKLYSHTSQDLIEIDPTTGQVTVLAAPGLQDVQALTTDSQGRIFGGRAILYEFDPQTGAVLSQLPLMVVAEFPDFRGMEFVRPEIVTIDFETEDDFLSALVNGQDISPAQEFGRLLTVQGFGPNLGAALFDTTPGGPNDPSQDRDLLVGLGNALILQNSQVPAQSAPGIFDRPNDDQDGGTLVFEFSGQVELLSVDLIDIDAGPGGFAVVKAFDQAGGVRIFDVPPGWTRDVLVDGPPGFATLDLGTLAVQPGFTSIASATQSPGFDGSHVVRLEILLDSSGAVDNLRFVPNVPRPRSIGLPAARMHSVWR